MNSRHVRGSSILALLVAAAPLVAQGVTSQLAGRVLDKQGSAVSGATVSIRNLETGFVRTTQTDEGGRYLATALPVGPYAVTVTKAGFQTASNVKVALNLGDAAPLTIRLAPETSAVVEVVAAAFISPDNLANLPVFNRSFTNLATLTPQVVVDSSRGNLAIAGQRGVNSSINIDGGDNNEPFFGGALGAAEGKTPFTVSIEAIREYQVITDGASAEFGRMGGGYVNAITKSGSNDLTGSVFYYERPKSMVARKPTLNGTLDQVQDFKQQQFGFSVGGPIIKDKLFYFVAYDGQRRNDPINFVWGGAAPVTLNATTYPNDAALLSRGFNYTPKSDSDTFFGRVDWNVNTDHTLQFRVNRSVFNGNAYTGVSSAYENSVSDDIKTLSLVAQWNWIISPTLLNELRVNFGRDDMPRDVRASIPEVSISVSGGSTMYYGANPYPREYTTKRTQFTDTLSYVTPLVQIKGGIDVNRINVSEIFSAFSRGYYNFSSLTNFRAGNWSYFRQRFSLQPGVDAWSAGKFDATEDQIAAFIQSDWRLTDTFKLGAGLRFDRQTHPDFPIVDFSNPLAASMPVTARIPTDNSISPRLSFTWTPEFDHGKTVIRGSAGRYVSTTPSVFLYQAYTVNGVRMAQVQFTPANQAALVGAYPGFQRGAGWNANAPFVFASMPTGAPGVVSDLWSFSPDFKNPRTNRVNLGAERGVGSWVLGVSASYAKTTDLERATDLNLGTPAANAYGRLVFPAARPNLNYGVLGEYVSDASSLYHAYTFSARYEKPDSPFTAQVYYTYAINKDNDSNERNFSGWSADNTQILGNEWSYANTDVRHNLTGTFTYLEKRWTGLLFGATYHYISGTPYTLLYNSDLNHDFQYNDRFYINGQDTGRNSQRTSSNSYIDLRISRDFKFTQRVKLQVSADVFNVLNRQDTYRLVYVLGTSTDAAPATGTKDGYVGSPRQVQLGARLSF